MVSGIVIIGRWTRTHHYYYYFSFSYYYYFHKPHQPRLMIPFICPPPLSDGTIVAKHRKVHLFDIDVPGRITFKESDTLSPGNTVTVIDTPYGKIGIGIW